MTKNKLKKIIRKIIKEEKQLLTESTRARIGILYPNGKIETIYCHFGHIDDISKILKKYYSDIKKVKKLINLGDVSYIDKSIEPEGDHSFNDPERGVTVFYGRDRGEKNNVESKKSKSIQDLLNSKIIGIEYVYLYDVKNKEWKYIRTKEHPGKMKKL